MAVPYPQLLRWLGAWVHRIPFSPLSSPAKNKKKENVETMFLTYFPHTLDPSQPKQVSKHHQN